MDQPWHRYYEPGVPVQVPYPEGMLVHHILEQTAERFPNRPATIFPNRLGQTFSEGRVSYRDLDRAATRFANGLAKLGIQKGDRVALVLPNSPQFLIAYFGALKMGAVVVPFDLGYSPEQMEWQLVDCGAETVITMTNFYPPLKQVQANTLVTRVVVSNIKDYFSAGARFFFSLSRERSEGFRVSADPRDYSFRQLLRLTDESYPLTSVDPDDLALLQYTRDSAGTPCGAMLTHHNLVSNCLQTAAWRPDAEEGHEVTLGIIPFFLPSGMNLTLLSSIVAGGALILFPDMIIEEVLAAIEKYRPTYLPGNPELYGAILNYPAIRKYDLRSIRTSISADLPLPAGIASEWEAKTTGRLVEGYGRAEAGPLTLANPVHGGSKPGSIGIPLPGTLARIAAPADVDASVPDGQVGYLAIHGPQVCSGYWNRPELSAGKLRAGWLVTDEYARVDADGFFYLVGANDPSR